ncbi:MAG: peptide ABC transporter substrate-binding protein [Candidatus Muproteobacteria bacterium RBG_16_65_34]|uniref:Peptide ABC transporter substrate-binding protein n=1 Tax=Candidatus Muproteobacteria bacterium RBG_16_65_34 TaxID=1817760 RepID=A0A1F6TMI9_9PROT|nr:MAG: peptide ABC transporter substrate-binding protein [Candidatus Muproteobacteria bacterium RBG_16_65_34]
MIRPRTYRILLSIVAAVFSLSAHAAWNNPYPSADRDRNILYAAFRERPKHLDPARSYSSNEYEFIAQVYEPPFQYHYLKRPYALAPLTAVAVPKPVYLDRQGRRLPQDAPAQTISYSVYEIRIRPGVYYQPHPAFARDDKGDLRYQALTERELGGVYAISDFSKAGTRELVAADYVYQIKRLAHPKLHSPILSVMQDYIVGLKDYVATLKRAHAEVAQGREEGVYLDLTRYPLAGVEAVDRYTYRVKINGKYPQILYWMAMPFFAPMPPEADHFFSQPGMAQKNLTLDWYPVGTGPYMLTVNNPNRRMVLERNPNFRDERYPAEGEPEDAAEGLFADAGKRLPFIDKVMFSLEKENIPYWSKFLQGYYDRSGVLTESFDQAIRFSGSGDTEVSEAMQGKGIHLLTSVASSTYYLGFNMLDPVVGGLSERARKLRQAVSIAIDYEEQISIFRNGRGIAAQGPLPPGIFGYEEGCAGMNPYVYDCVDGTPRRKPIEAARRLLAESGYPDGQDAKTGKPLLLYFDTAATGPEEKAKLDWMTKQLRKLDVQLVVRATDYNTFQKKMRQGEAQLFEWGWNADYPDPENFLFLLYGPNKKVGADGENAANYDDPGFNRLFERVKNMDNGPERLALIRKMLDITRRDAPWAWGTHPKLFLLEHAWVYNTKPNTMANNTLKYLRLEPRLRAQQREAWNRPVVWPMLAVLGLVALAVVPAVIAWRRRERGAAR